MSASSTTGTVVQVRRLAEGADLPLPTQATPDAAGFDLRARVDDDVTLAPGQRAMIPTGLAIALPSGYEAQVRPRSGLAAKHGIGVVNAPGTIDADYRGEIAVILINLGDTPFVVTRGERIAQLVVQRLPQISFVEVDALPETERGTGGFGHTGRQ